jgi:hypothetical protein
MNPIWSSNAAKTVAQLWADGLARARFGEVRRHPHAYLLAYALALQKGHEIRLLLDGQRSVPQSAQDLIRVT